MQIWNQLAAVYSRMGDTIIKDIGFDLSKKDKFCSHFQNMCKEAEKTTTQNKAVFVRHTISAIIAATIIKIKPLSDKKGRANENIFFIANEVIALSFALEYLKTQINELIEKNKLYDSITNFFPTAPINKNKYHFDNLVRNLYFEAKNSRNSICVDTWTTIFMLMELNALNEYGIELPN